MLVEKHTVELSLWGFFKNLKTIAFQGPFIIIIIIIVAVVMWPYVKIGMRESTLFGYLHLKNFTSGRRLIWYSKPQIPLVSLPRV